MKKYLKILFSRFTFVALTIIVLFILEVILMFGGLYFAAESISRQFENETVKRIISLTFEVLRWAIIFITTLHIVNRDMIPEAKIPWILCVVALNLLGVATYAVFSHNRPSRRQRRLLRTIYEQAERYERPVLSEEELEAGLKGWKPVSDALLFENPRALVYTGTRTEYFPTGEAFFGRYLEDLKSAKRYIFLEYFILERGKMWGTILSILKEKVREGVEVRVIYDDIGCMGKLRAGYYRELRKAGIKCFKFNPFVPIVANIHNNRDHRKITVIDGVIGYTGGLNLADEYINEVHPFGVWKDAAIRLEGEGVKGLLLMFLRLFGLRGGQEDFGVYLPEEYPVFEGEGYVQPYGDGPRPLYPRQLGENVYLNLLGTAKKSVWIMTPYLIIDYRMREAMLSAAARGVDVRILTPHIPDKKIPFALTRSNYAALIRGGVKIYEYTPGFVHSKNFLCDGETAVVGTINLDYRSLMHHYENAVLLYGAKANDALKQDFEATFAISALQTEEDAKRNVVSRGICEIAKVFAPLF